jgi:hypothetical protein
MLFTRMFLVWYMILNYLTEFIKNVYKNDKIIFSRVHVNFLTITYNLGSVTRDKPNDFIYMLTHSKWYFEGVNIITKHKRRLLMWFSAIKTMFTSAIAVDNILQKLDLSDLVRNRNNKLTEILNHKVINW